MRRCPRLALLWGAAGEGLPGLSDLQPLCPKRSHKFGGRFHQNCELRFFK